MPGPHEWIRKFSRDSRRKRSAWFLKARQSVTPAAVAAIAERAETRRAFLKGIREHLALAAEARREGLSEDPNFKINLDYKKNLLLADLYMCQAQ